jgi:hypothetical protein
MATRDPAERGEPREESGGGDGGVGPSFLGAAAWGWRWRGRTFHDGGRERRAGAGSDFPFLEQPRGDGDGGVGPSMMAAERGERGQGCSGGELEPISGFGGGGAESGARERAGDCRQNRAPKCVYVYTIVL